MTHGTDFMAFFVKDLLSWNKCLQNADISIFSQLLLTFSVIFSIQKDFAKYYIHAKFRINRTIQNNNYRRGRICPHPDIMAIYKKPSLFRLNSYQMNFSSFHTCSDAEATVVQCTTQEPWTLPRSPISNCMSQDPDHLFLAFYIVAR